MIFYFTGTGNSLYVAKELDEEIISIPQVIKQERLEFAADSIGIVCPVYGHEMPGMVKRMPVGNQMPARNRLPMGRLPSFTLPVTFLRRGWLPFMKPLAGNLPERLQ